MRPCVSLADQMTRKDPNRMHASMVVEADRTDRGEPAVAVCRRRREPIIVEAYSWLMANIPMASIQEAHYEAFCSCRRDSLVGCLRCAGVGAAGRCRNRARHAGHDQAIRGEGEGPP